ncbi:MAG: GtrA-like protein [Candidatus Parcubacteria bacterium]|jgi:putative flippase GtrA
MNTSIDIGVFIFLKYIFNIDNQSNWIIFINLISIILAIIFSYFANKHLTFQHKSKTNTKEIGSFLLVNFLGFLVNTGILKLVIIILPPQLIVPNFNLLIDPAIIGKIVATAGSMVVSFIGYKFFVFNK